MTGYTYERKNLSSGALGRMVYYGVLTPQGVDVRETLYFFHAGNGDDRQFVELNLASLLSADVTQAMHARGIQIILPSVGVSFMYGEYREHFFNELMPEVESSMAVPFGEELKRYLAGFSMGGRAALSLFFEDPAKYQGVGVQFATLSTFDYTNPEEVTAFQNRTRIKDPEKNILVTGYSSIFPTLKEFQSQDPIALARKAPLEALKGKPVYFDVGSEDDYGLQEGARALSEILTARHVPHRFVEEPGLRHDAAIVVKNWNSLVRMLLRI